MQTSQSEELAFSPPPREGEKTASVSGFSLSLSLSPMNRRSLLAELQNQGALCFAADSRRGKKREGRRRRKRRGWWGLGWSGSGTILRQLAALVATCCIAGWRSCSLNSDSQRWEFWDVTNLCITCLVLPSVSSEVQRT